MSRALDLLRGAENLRVGRCRYMAGHEGRVVLLAPLEVERCIEALTVESSRPHQAPVAIAALTALVDVLGQRKAKELAGGTVDREMHPGDRAVDCDAVGLPHELLAPAQCFCGLRRTQEAPQEISNHESFGRVAARKRAVSRRQD